MSARLALLALVVLSPLALAAAAPTAPAILAAPGAWLTQYATPIMATAPAAGLQFDNQDIMRHDVVAVDFGADGKPWCADVPAGHCPLFWTPLINRGQVVDVQGVSELAPGTYDFACSIHAGMTGKLVIAGAS